MATVTIGQVGEVMKSVEASTVSEAVSSYGLEGSYTVKINGQPATMESALSEGDFVTIGSKIKGGQA